MRISKEARKRQILVVTATLIEANGFNGVVTKDIASKAEVSDTLIFRHFGSLENLYRQVCDKFINNIVSVPIDAETEDISSFITSFVEQVIAHNLDEPRAIRLLTRAQLERPDYVKGIQHSFYQSGAILELEYLFKQKGYSVDEARAYTHFLLSALLEMLRNYLVYNTSTAPPDPKKSASFLTNMICEPV